MNNNNILTPKEKEYLENFLRPFKKRVWCIQKVGGRSTETCYIAINIKGATRVAKYEEVFMPFFDKDDMYKGMEPYHTYTLEELGLFQNE